MLAPKEHNQDEPQMNDLPTPDHTARCSCGALSISVTGEPVRVHACSCLACQRRTGSALANNAFFETAAVTSIVGEATIYREIRESGRWQDYHFCPICGVSVYLKVEIAPDHIGVPVGGFADPAFAAPDRFLWTRHRHHWLPLPDGIDSFETQ
jgi:hypothetical protein